MKRTKAIFVTSAVNVSCSAVALSSSMLVPITQHLGYTIFLKKERYIILRLCLPILHYINMHFPATICLIWSKES